MSETRATHRSRSYTPAELNTMSYQDFRAVVEAETKSDAHGAAAALRDVGVLRRWYEALIGLQKSVEGQLAALGADARARSARFEAKLIQIEGRFTDVTGSEAAKERRNQIRKARQEQSEAEADYERWRAAAVRWKTSNDERLVEARFLLRERGDDFFMDRTVEERNRALARVMELEGALRRWRDSFVDDDEPTPEDMELMKYV